MGTPSGPAGAKKLLEIPWHSPSATVSFENLIALASYQERIKDARKIIWRDRGQPVADLHTLRNCLEHAGIGGLRTAGLAFVIRASFNVFLALIKLRKVPRARWFGLIRHAIFGSDCWRFAAMLGTFAALYKFLINALPILIPACPSTAPSEEVDEESTSSTSSPYNGLASPGLRRRAPSLSLSAHAQMVIVRKRTRRWESALAGAISGLAIFWEKRSRRVVIAQQLFVRGLQGSYNSYSERSVFSIPYGAVIVFSIACGQIMYAFFLRPDSLPRSYVGWIQEASKAPSDSFIFNRKAVYEHAIDVPSLDRLIARRDTTPANVCALLDLRERALAGAVDLPHYVPCYALHPMTDTCSGVAVSRFIEVARWMLPIYSALHFVPSLLRWGHLRTDPVRFLTRVTVGSLRSSAFLGAFVVICQAVFCIKHTLYERLMAMPLSSPLRRLLPQSLIDLLISKGSWWVSGFATGLALLIEDRRRHAELAMYVLPKGLESLWVVARGHGLIWHTDNWGEGILACVGMAMVMVRHLTGCSSLLRGELMRAALQTIYQNDPHHLSGLVRKLLYQVIGPN
ncbi:hypothetical protein DFH08DRAFT_716104 [Mycena albidolilacea]|uniref:Transmembrane protein 135 N-terminal domain-containing protein n=1 Tax=Mycena albidolilacea TaxID=1033008 RepID=A0AAD6ZAZ6_9AGAR|nr:hypothetical protein DFH08DRAFT_716104 [Mycena albidolilacea]